MPPKPPKATEPPAINSALAVKAVRYRVWHTKEAEAAYISQLELQSCLSAPCVAPGCRWPFRASIPALISFDEPCPWAWKARRSGSPLSCASRSPPRKSWNASLPRMLRGLRLDRLEEIPVNDKSVGSVQKPSALHGLGRRQTAVHGSVGRFHDHGFLCSPAKPRRVLHGGHPPALSGHRMG